MRLPPTSPGVDRGYLKFGVTHRSTSARRIGIRPQGCSVGPVPATDVKLIQGTLIEQTRKIPLRGGLLRLCASTAPTCESKIEVASNSTQILYLKPLNADAGQFTGVVTVNTPAKLTQL